MGKIDTSLGAGGKQFPNTTWGMLSRLRDSSDPARLAGMEALARRYWKPVYHYLRAVGSKTNEDAKDLAQGFFAWLVEGESLRRFAPERGSFRNYLKVLLKGYMHDAGRAARALKRGGGASVFTLEEAKAAEESIATSPESDPERTFDRAWMMEVVNEAIDRVRKEEDGSAPFRLYEEYDLGSVGEQRPTYAELAARLGISAGSVEAQLTAMRQKVREEILSELSRLASDDQELQEEWNALFGTRRKGG